MPSADILFNLSCFGRWKEVKDFFRVASHQEFTALCNEHGENALIQCIHGAHIQEKLHTTNLQQNEDYSKTIDALVQNGVSVNQTDNSNRTGLHWTAQYNLDALARELLKHGADAEIEDSFGYKPLHLAIFHGSDRCLEAIAELQPKVTLPYLAFLHIFFLAMYVVGFKQF